MSTYPSQPWQEDEKGVDNQFSRPKEGVFYHDNYDMDGLMNGGPQKPRDYMGQQQQGHSPLHNNWNNYSHNGYRDESNKGGGEGVHRGGQEPGYFPGDRMHPRRHAFNDSGILNGPGPFNRHHHYREHQRDSCLNERGFILPPRGLHGEGYPQREYQRRPEYLPRVPGPPSHGPSPHSGSSYPLPHPTPPPPLEDRSQVVTYGSSQFQSSASPHARKYDSYSSPTLTSSSWSPTVDSPDSPQLPAPPPLPGRGRGGPHHFNPVVPPEDNPIHPQRRAQNFNHNARIHDNVHSGLGKDGVSPRLHQRRLDMKKETASSSSSSSLSSLRGVGVPPLSMIGHNEDKIHMSAEMDHTSRDPRLNRKSNHQQQQQQQQVSSTHPKRKQDIHLVVHHILSEHSYSKRCTEAIEKESEKIKKSTAAEMEMSNGLSPSFLSYVAVYSDCVLTKSQSPPSSLNAEENPCLLQDNQESEMLVDGGKPELPLQKEEASLCRSNNSTPGTECGATVEDRLYSDGCPSPVPSLDGFVLDLDTELSSSDDDDYDLQEDVMLGGNGTSYYLGPHANLSEKALTQWSITNFDIRNNLIRLSKVDSPRAGLQLHNILNGRVVPNRLAIYASNSSPSGSNSNRIDSPDVSPTRHRTDKGNEVGEIDGVRTRYETMEICGDEGVQEIEWKGCTLRKRRRWESLKMSKRTSRSSHRYSTSMKSMDGKRKTRIPFKEFRAEILTTRSRAETATMKRRLEMEKEIEKHERERIQTARPGELEPSSPATSLDLNMDDRSSEALSFTSSSLVSSKDIDDSSTRSNASILEEFSADVIARCKKISTARNSGDTPLHKVCRTGKLEMARYLIMVETASVNAQDNAGWTPLHEACCSKHISIADFLLKAGADANMSAADGTRPVHDAIESGNLEMVKLLLSHGADPMAEIGEKTPLEFALSNDQKDIHAFLESMIKERLKVKSQKNTPVPSPSSTLQKMLTRASRKEEELEDSQIAIPVNGYELDGAYCGEELSYPLFYVTPIIELSDCPFLPVYNFKLSQGLNPRRHNFHLISDIVSTLELTEEKLLEHCNRVVPLEIPVADVVHQIECSPFHRKIPDSIASLPPTKTLRFLPLCTQLQQLLDIQVENLDN